MPISKLRDRSADDGQERVVDCGVVGAPAIGLKGKIRNYVFKYLPEISLGDTIKVVILHQTGAAVRKFSGRSEIFVRREFQRSSEARARKEISNMIRAEKSSSHSGNSDLSDEAKKIVSEVRASVKSVPLNRAESDESMKIKMTRRDSLPVTMRRRKSPVF